MAKWHVLAVFGASLAIFALTGCQQNTAAIVSLPPPGFDPPRMAAAEPVAPRTVFAPVPAPITASPSKGPIVRPPVVASNAPRDWVPPVAPRPWRWIVIHHSATTTGGAAAFDKMHRAKGWDELGYDFVIGNGTDTADGQIEVGPRWIKQKYGAHAKTPDNRYNEFGIGICLVGNFDVERPTPQQMRSVDKLVGYLMKTYHITPDRVLGHGDTKPTDCPGRYMNVAVVRRQATQLAGFGAVAASDETPAGGEMLSDLPPQ